MLIRCSKNRVKFTLSIIFSHMHSDILSALADVIERRKAAAADSSYVASLHDKGIDAMAAKIAEEADEVVQAAMADDVKQVIYETADLWFHNLVLLSHFQCTHEEVLSELARRFGRSGLEEKASRGR